MSREVERDSISESELKEMERVAVLDFKEAQLNANQLGLILSVQQSAFFVGHPAEDKSKYQGFSTINAVKNYLLGYMACKTRLESVQALNGTATTND